VLGEHVRANECGQEREEAWLASNAILSDLPFDFMEANNFLFSHLRYRPNHLRFFQNLVPRRSWASRQPIYTGWILPENEDRPKVEIPK
jgi:hypothetical protein